MDHPSYRDVTVGAFGGAVPALKRLIYIGGDAPAGYLPYETLRSAAAAISDGDIDRRSGSIGVDDVINMQYTSGTTGFPKGVMLTSRNIVNNGHALGSMLGYAPADGLCLSVPLFHAFGCVIDVLGPLPRGATLCAVA